MAYLYIMTNEAMPGLVKIGWSDEHPSFRASQLSSSTGSPLPFSIAHFVEVYDPRASESFAHNRLHDFRLSKKREFFRCGVDAAIEAVEAAARSDDARQRNIDFIAEILLDGTPKEHWSTLLATLHELSPSQLAHAVHVEKYKRDGDCAPPMRSEDDNS